MRPLSDRQGLRHDRGGSAATVAAGSNNKLGSVGIPMVNTLVAAFEPGTDKELPIGERGELCISGPTTMKATTTSPTRRT